MPEVSAELSILADLVAIPSVPGACNEQWINYVRTRMAGAGARLVVVPSPAGDCDGLIASIGPEGPGGIVLSGHMDVVGTDGQAWAIDPFQLRREGARLYGRGTTDMKGFNACAIALMEDAARGELSTPIHLALSADEESSCLSAVSLSRHIAQELSPVRGVLVGEPTALAPANRQRSSYTCEVNVTGRAAHAGQPALGVSATALAARLITWLDDRSGAAADPDTTTFSVGKIQGGTASNIIAAHCEFDWDVRLSPKDSLDTVLADARAYAAALIAESPGAEITISETARFPGFFTSPDNSFAKACLAVSPADTFAIFPAGSEAGLYEAEGLPAIVMGPGHIAQAHVPDEYLELDQLAACAAQLRHLIDT